MAAAVAGVGRVSLPSAELPEQGGIDWSIDFHCRKLKSN